MRKLFLTFIAFSCLVFGITDNQTQERNLHIQGVKTAESSANLLESKIEEWAKEKGIEWGPTHDGKYFTYAIETINVDISDPRFGRKRIIAYEKALLEAQKELANFLYKSIATESIRKLFSDESLIEEGEDIKNSEILKRKLIKLSEAVIDNALKKLGEDPSKYGHISFEKKVDKFIDAFRRVTVIKAMGELTGSIILRTVEGLGKDGSYSVGVVLMYSPKLKAFAKSFLYSEETYPRKKGHPIDYYLPKTPEEWLSSWGVRIVFDENGEPVILSYGQWAYPVRKNRFINQRRRKHALMVASQLADAYITEFLNSHAYFEDKSEISNMVREFERKGIEESTKEMIDNIIDRVWEKAKKEARVRVSGISKYTQREVTFGGYNYVIVVKYLSPERARLARELKRRKVYGTQKGAETQRNYEEKVLESRDVTDINAW